MGRERSQNAEVSKRGEELWWGNHQQNKAQVMKNARGVNRVRKSISGGTENRAKVRNARSYKEKGFVNIPAPKSTDREERWG